ncbi:hypothetical protein [Mesorhizobium sp.]|uniref:hypothetical protein n=1 Tax=Mesorhizobium sp. TaxID=1871066 RepID=UPI0025BCFCED|nr:hypothetical protein [Mesorhizobium sp.]
MLLEILPTFRGEVFLKITLEAKKLSADYPVWRLDTIDTDGPIAEWAARNRSILLVAEVSRGPLRPASTDF